MTHPRPCRLFYSYAHKDEDLRRRLEAHLTALEREGIIVGWKDRCIAPGREWAGAIEQALEAADIILLLISTDFIASGYCHDVELKRAMERHADGTAVVIPVFLKPCDWKWLPFGKLQGIPDDTKPVTKWGNREDAFAGIAEAVRKVAKALQSGVWPKGAEKPESRRSERRITNLPPRNPNFAGRDELLAALEEALAAGPVALTPAALYGLGGIGKSQTALEYAWRHEARFNVTWWVRAEQQETLVSDLAELASTLKLSGPSETDIPAMAKSAIRWLASNPGWLLIFDNATGETSVRDWFPGGPGAVIVTSRDGVWLGARSLEVDGLSEDDAIAFLTARSGDADSESAGELARALDRLPLALEQAAAFILERHWKIDRYLRLYTQRQAELLKAGTALNYPATVATTWEISFQALEKDSPAAAHLLRLCAFLAPDDIPLDLLRPGASVLESPLREALADDFDTGNMMAALLRYSLVKVKDETVFIHRLVQAVLRERLGQEGRTKWANLAVKLIDQVFVFEEADRSTWATAERLLPHAEIAASHGSSSEVAAELKSLLLRAGRCLDNRALHDRAQALKHSAQALFDHAALGIAVVRDDGRVIQANQALVTMLGFSEAELARQNLADLTHPDDRLADAQAAHRLLAGEVDSYSRENRYRRSDGTWFWGRLTASVTPGEDDSRFRAVMIADIDNHKRAEANLSLFRKVMDASQEAIAIMSPGGHILYANSALHRLFGVDAESARGAHYREYFPPASRENLDQAIAHTLARGESREGVIDAQHMSGQVFPIWQRTGALRDESGRLQFIFAFMHDHTEQQLFENELISAKEAAEEANAAKTHFLAAASHDLRQPMQALSMFVSVLAAQSMDTKQAALVSRIQDCQIALEGLLNGLLDISKLEAGLVVPQMGEFSADALMDRLGAEFEPLCAAAGLSFKHLPCKAVVHSDPSLLERILRNLLNNAIRYTPKGRIVFGCRRRGNRLRIEVWDTGIGIPQGELRNIFREFHQVGNPQRDRHQGLGLGLAIVRRLADLLNHEFGVRSEEGRGSVFSVQVPMTSSRPQLSSNPRKPSGPTAAATILVIEDDADVLEGLCLILSSWGHSVIGATSGEAAVQQMLMSSRTPDLVIADYRLQDGETGGQVVIHLWTRLGQDVPAIILSDETSAERLRQVHALGFPVLHKPVHANVLKGAIDEALAG